MSKVIGLIAHSDNPPVHELLKVLNRLGYQALVVRLPFGDPLPEVESCAGYIIMGSITGVYQKDSIEWMQREIVWLEKVLKADKPVFGICFGCQLLAHVMGGEVTVGESGFEFGFVPVKITHEDPIFGTELNGKDVFQSHGDTYTLPEGATQLMAGEMYPQQAAKFKHNVYGTQFHPETILRQIRNYQEFKVDMGKTMPPNVPDDMSEHILIAQQKLPDSHEWLDAFLERLFGPADKGTLLDRAFKKLQGA